MVSNVGALQEQSAPTAGFFDTVASSEVLTELLVSSAALTDSAASSDTLDVDFGYSTGLTDSITSADEYLIVIPLADTISAFDQLTIPQNIAADIVTSADAYIILSVFPQGVVDTAKSSDFYSGIFVGGGPFYQCGPIPIFPSVPQSFPIKLSLVMDTTIGTTKSLREMRVPNQPYPLWDIEVPFEELLDQTQNQAAYGPFAGTNNFEQLCQQWLMMYGQTGIFAFDAPWDDSRTDQPIATGDGVTTNFEVFRTWGTGSFVTVAPIGLINTITNVKVNGTIVSPTTYSHTRSYIDFVNPPAAGATITMTFSFYYICRWVEDEQDFEEFAKNRWAVPSLKFRAVYWPGCQ
jgi:hypothetical protein